MARLALLLFSGMTLAISQPAAAQVFDMGSLTATLSVDHVTQSERQRARSGRSSMAPVGQRLSLRPLSSADIAKVNGTASSLRYSPSLQRRQANYRQFVERSRRADPSGVAGLQATLRTDPIRQMDASLGKFGLRTSNVADAYAVYLVEAWEAAHGASGEPSRAQAQAVRAQAADAILRRPEFAGASDAEKQEFAEALLIQAYLIGSAKYQARSNPAQLRAIANAVRQGARATGIDLDSMTLTDSGFVGGKVGALDPAEGAGPRLAEGRGPLIGAALIGLGVSGYWLLRSQRARG